MAKEKEIVLPFDQEEESTGGGIRNFTGRVPVRILKVTTGRSENKDSPFVQLDYEVIGGDIKGRKGNERFYLSPKALKRIRLVLEALGLEVPKKKIKIPVNKIKGGELVFELEPKPDSEKGYCQVTFEGIYPIDTWSENGSKKGKKDKKKGKKKDKAEDVEDLDLDEL